MKNQRYKDKFFPFSPGIPWKIERGKYIIPEVDFETWHKALDGKDIIITAFGGLIESFFSLCAAEAIVSYDSSYKIYWLGNSEYLPFIKEQGLCKQSQIRLTHDVLCKYPVPLFMDSVGNAYLNILNNYLIRTSYWGKYPEEVKLPVLEQIARNIMIPWRNYVPKLRNLGTEFIENLQSIGRIRLSSKIITIIINNTDKDILQWSLQNIKELSQLASHKGWKVIVFCKNKNIFYGSNILVFDYNISNILQTIKRSWVVLSNDINWLLVSLIVSDVKIISKPVNNQYDLFKNAEYLEVSNDIFTNRNLLPIDVFDICEGL